MLAAWLNWQEQERAARAHDSEMAAAMDEHAQKVFDSVSLLLELVTTRFKSADAEMAASTDSSDFLHALGVQLGQIETISVSDSAGRVIASSRPVKSVLNIADRDYFHAHVEKETGLFISVPFLEGDNAFPSFVLSRRRSAADGSFAGIVSVSLSSTYFSHFYDEITPTTGNAATLTRLDGIILSRYPAPPLTPIVLLPIATRIEHGQPRGGMLLTSPIDGVTRHYAFRRLSRYPLYVVFGTEVAAVVSVWYRTLLTYGVVLALAACALLSVSLLVLRKGRDMRRHIRKRQRAEEYLHEALAAIPDGFSLYDEHDRLVIFNDAYRALSPIASPMIKRGVTFEEVLRAGAASKMTPAAFQARLVQHRHPVGAIEHRRPDGSWIRISEKRTPSGYIVGIRTDITAPKEQAEELRRLVDAAEKAARAKLAFLATMSHEIRTPLNAIVGFAALLSQTRNGEPFDDEKRLFVETINSSAGHLMGIVSDILDFTKLEAGGLKVESVPFSLKEISDRLNGVLKALIGPKPVVGRLDLDVALPAQVMGDQGRIYQVLLNLVGNAAKFTDAGSIAVSIARQEDRSGRRMLRCVVQDTGAGIDPDVQKNIFTPFEQGEASGNLRAAGTGLGLAISKRLVDAMGGEIGFVSAPGEGSVFWFTVPFEPVEGPVAQASEPLAPVLPALKILVADDAEPSRMLASLLLRKRGHCVDEVANGAQAFETVRGGDYDLVILDLQMPVMGGCEAARLIRALPAPRNSVPILALTAAVLDEEGDLALRAGMNGVLSKPFRADDLDRTIAAVLTPAPAPPSGDAEPRALVPMGSAC